MTGVSTGYLFAPIPEQLVYDVDVDPLAVRVYALLMRHGLDPSSCFPSHRRIAELLSISQRSVQRPLVTLEQHGWIERVPRFDERGDRLSDGFVVHVAQRGHRAHEREGSALTDADPSALTDADSNESKDEREQENEQSLAVARLVDFELPAVVREAGRLDDAIVLCERMHAQLVDRGYSPSAARSKRWLLDMEALLRIDGRPVEQVGFVLDWLHTGTDDVASFWRSNVLSPDKLRKQWQRMSDQYKSKVKNRSRSRAGLAGDEAARRAGVDPAEVQDAASKLVRELFGPETDDREVSALRSNIVDVESRGA